MSELLRWRDLLPTDGVRTGRLRMPDDILAWGVGPWVHEPDKVSWTDPLTGRPCLVVRNHMGSLCGYVAVDPGHRLHGVSYNQVDCELEVHGGLTFSDKCDDGPHGRICHIPEPGKPHNVWWFGFDCGHAWDFTPMLHGPLMQGLGILRHAEPWAVYRGVGYVITEVQALARQLAAYRGAGIPA
jgi:GNAT superfamily N-acetyltransferase